MNLAEQVATKVMSWRRLTYFERYGPAHHDTAYYRTTRTPYWHASDGSAPVRAEPTSDYYNQEEAWSPEDDIADAWQVVEKLRERFPQIDIEILPDRVTVTLWERCRHDGHALDPLDEVVADTAPLAICRAALQAVGVVPESV